MQVLKEGCGAESKGESRAHPGVLSFEERLLRAKGKEDRCVGRS